MTISKNVMIWFCLMTGPWAAGIPNSPVAIVSEMQGKADVLIPGQAPKLLKLFDWLEAGSSVMVRPQSRVVLVFSNGKRYELPSGNEAVLQKDSLKNYKGFSRILVSVPPLRRLPELAASLPPGNASGAIRIRGDIAFTRLYPNSNQAVLSDSVVLRYSAISQAQRYRIVLQDEAGRAVFDEETTETEVTVPSGIVQPGSHYHWHITTIGKGPVHHGYGEFTALPANIAQERALFKKKIDKNVDAENLALMAAIDRTLGLLYEARNEFSASLQEREDPQIRAIVEQLDQEIAQASR
jgi:hypothetical protein